MEMAYRLLQSGKYKVKDVVWMVGYTNASHFIDALKKIWRYARRNLSSYSAENFGESALANLSHHVKLEKKYVFLSKHLQTKKDSPGRSWSI